ncbi:MAG: glycosyltransferase family 77 protein [Verrucomicrobiae bacterium]|nr:glycosyltransferase family 77 protein [Verrucomicrobiae bacterium]NNJ44016.1 hypothetical protein [Akkermansiaceae bacterium]
MATIVFLQFGHSGLEQLAISLRSYKKNGGELKKVLYTDCQDVPSEIMGLLDEVRPWGNPVRESGHAKFGTSNFGMITREKSEVMRDALNKDKEWILFSDGDILALKPFRSDLEHLLSRWDVLVSCEGETFNPHNYCTGLLGLKYAEHTFFVLDRWVSNHNNMLQQDPSFHDQDAFNDLMHKNSDLEKSICRLANGFAMSGWFYPLFDPQITTRLPFFFHCNYVMGNEAKVKRLSYLSEVIIEKNSTSHISKFKRVLHIVRHNTGTIVRILRETTKAVCNEFKS